MRAIAILALLAAVLGITGGCKPSQDNPPVGDTGGYAQPMPTGVTTGWPVDPRDPEDTRCGIGIHYEDTAALTDAQLDTARRYVAHICWGAPIDGWPADAEHTYYHHH